MPQKNKGPRLWLYKRPGRPSVYQIRDGTVQKSTGFGEHEYGAAKAALDMPLIHVHIKGYDSVAPSPVPSLQGGR